MKHTRKANNVSRKRALNRRFDPPRFEFIPLPMSSTIDKYYRAMQDQKENTCGAYAASYILRGIGFNKFQGEDVSEDLCASLAAVNISSRDEIESNSIIQKIVAGEESFEEADKRSHARLYLYSLPTTDKEEELGGSSEGVGYAIDQISRGKMSVIPIPARDPNNKNKTLFTPSGFEALVRLIVKNCRKWNAQIIMNIQCIHLLDPSQQENENLLDVLLRMNEERNDWPLDNWNVGHFVSVSGFFMNGNESNTYFVIRDTYRKRGQKGVHLQPQENVRKALLRSDGREGGILLIVAKKFRPEAERIISRLLNLHNFDYWNNGTTFHSIPRTKSLLPPEIAIRQN